VLRASDTYCKAQNYQQNGVKNAKLRVRGEKNCRTKKKVVEQEEKSCRINIMSQTVDTSQFHMQSSLMIPVISLLVLFD